MTSQDRQQDFSYLRFAPLLFIGPLLLFTFRLYRFAYFWLDDFNCLSQIQVQSALQMLGHVANPASDFFRPVGMLLYWIAFRLFDRDPFPYHCLLWAIHAFNVCLVYLFLKRLTQSRAGASLGALLFASQAVFSDVFWNFGDIFEVSGQALFLLGLLIWTGERQTVRNVVMVSVVFLLALKAKEMAITLPAICLTYDLLLRRPLKWKTLGYLLAPVLIGVGYGWMRMIAMRSADRSQPYYMDLSWLTLGRGFGGYFSSLFATNWRWQSWAIGFIAAFIAFAWRRNRLALFFQGYVFITFLPLILLVNHRDPVYWYFPIVGVCGMAALVGKAVSYRFLRLAPKAAVAPAACVILALISFGEYRWTRNQTGDRRAWQQGLAAEYARFVVGIEAIHPPESDEPVFFTSMPRLFDVTVLRDATAVALQQPDVETRLVEQCPVNATYCLHFGNSGTDH